MKQQNIAEIFPTPVGMVRRGGIPVWCVAYFPHARGDGPLASARARCPRSFSPRPWGWSGGTAGLGGLGGIFPTPVGMVRVLSAGSADDKHFPHARGDGP